ncbi:MAG TPA: hypothetical protein VN522_05370 [Solirubrobacterales bacterium]|nr:hypothetical protein [Solirubrobacterales bacterium]
MKVALTIVFDPQGGNATRVTSLEVARVDLDHPAGADGERP